MGKVRISTARTDDQFRERAEIFKTEIAKAVRQESRRGTDIAKLLREFSAGFEVTGSEAAKEGMRLYLAEVEGPNAPDTPRPILSDGQRSGRPTNPSEIRSDSKKRRNDVRNGC
jgi:hypothetical protein